MDW
ncbi:fatty acid hydroxylase superfamily protein, partial [Vibrio parahaemolyticus EKP-028]|jgi:hypothetical protein